MYGLLGRFYLHVFVSVVLLLVVVVVIVVGWERWGVRGVAEGGKEGGGGGDLRNSEVHVENSKSSIRTAVLLQQ